MVVKEPLSPYISVSFLFFNFLFFLFFDILKSSVWIFTANSIYLTIEKCCLPEELKLAEVYPVFKNKDDLEKENYRSVNVVPHMVKVFQRTMHHQIDDYLTEKLLKPIAGSKQNHSTQHCLSCMLRIWKNVLHKGGCIFAIFMGLWKAFDLLNHDLLIAKLEVRAFETDALRYMKSFLKKEKAKSKSN